MKSGASELGDLLADSIRETPIPERDKNSSEFELATSENKTTLSIKFKSDSVLAEELALLESILPELIQAMMEEGEIFD